MKVKLIAVSALILAGIAVTISLVSGSIAKSENYNNSIAAAREKAEKGLPYVAVQNYRKAIAIDASKEDIYKEYMEQCRLLGEDYYTEAVKAYIKYFPESPDAYETLSEYYYEQKSYEFVLETALQAKELGLASNRVRDLFLECSMMYQTIGNGFSEATPFLGDYARVKMKDEYGFINTRGSYLIYPTYSDATFYMGGSASVYTDDEWCIVNDSGYKVARTDKPVDFLSFMSNGLVLFSLEGKYDYMTGALQVPDELRFDDATNFKNQVAAVKKDGKWALINSNFEMITDYVFDDVVRDAFNTCINNGVIFVKKDDKYYMADAAGNKITDTGFDDAYPFVGSEPAAVCENGKWGFVDHTGVYVIEPQYEEAKSFNIGLGAVCENGLWGYINLNGDIRIEHQFYDCQPFSSNGAAAVRQIKDEEIWTYIKLLPYDK